MNNDEERKGGQAGSVYGCQLNAPGASNPDLQIMGAMSVMFPVCKATGPHFSISEEFLHSTILRHKKPLGSWNLVNLLLSMNEA